MNTTLRRAEERGDTAFGGSAGLAGSVSKPLAIDLEKFRSKGSPKGSADPLRPIL
jgi:hypothetical protein